MIIVIIQAFADDRLMFSYSIQIHNNNSLRTEPAVVADATETKDLNALLLKSK